MGIKTGTKWTETVGNEGRLYWKIVLEDCTGRLHWKIVLEDCTGRLYWKIVLEDCTGSQAPQQTVVPEEKKVL